MNERIQELAKQAGYQEDMFGIGHWDMPECQKFAELIVKECADRVSQMVMMDKGHIPQDPHSQGWNSAVAYASKELKKYYGVE